MSVQVVCVCNRKPRDFETYYRPDLFYASLARFGVKPTTLGFDQEWRGLMTKPRRLRQWLREGNATADTLIVSDVFDVVFASSPEEVEAVYRAQFPAGAVVFNAEKGLFPRGELAYAFGETGTPFRYLNSGFFIGPPARILGILDAMWLDDIHDDYQDEGWITGQRDRWIHPNDQGWYQLMFAAQPVKMMLDAHGVLCQCCSACSPEEFDLDGERIRNRETKAAPLVFHFNGGSKNDLLPLFLPRLGLG